MQTMTGADAGSFCGALFGLGACSTSTSSLAFGARCSTGEELADASSEPLLVGRAGAAQAESENFPMAGCDEEGRWCLSQAAGKAWT
jgi:hypothetical protein